MRLNKYTASRIKSAKLISCGHFFINLYLNFNEIEKTLWKLRKIWRLYQEWVKIVEITV